ncbi:MAG TPA: hypothetical protein VF244_07470 [Acidimicrobiales bacterium]
MALVLAAGACGSDDSPDASPPTTSGLGRTRATTATTREPAGTRPVRLGTRSSPLPLGSEAAFENGWTVAVVGVTPDGTSAVMSENQFNDPPDDGEQFYLVRVSATYVGDGSSTPLGELTFSALDSRSTQVREGDCGVVPDAFDSFAEAFTGGSLTGNVCFAVPSATAGSLVMYVDAGFVDEQRAFFALA